MDCYETYNVCDDRKYYFIMSIKLIYANFTKNFRSYYAQTLMKTNRQPLLLYPKESHILVVGKIKLRNHLRNNNSIKNMHKTMSAIAMIIYQIRKIGNYVSLKRIHYSECTGAFFFRRTFEMHIF